VLVGILVGYAVAVIMTLTLPTTGVNADGVTYTYAWVVKFQQVADAAWFEIPSVIGFGALSDIKLVFDPAAILPILIMFIVTAVETVGDISGCIEGGMNREATDTELSGGVICDGLGSSLAAVFGVLPNTSFSQNVGLVSMTKVVNRMALACGAIFLIICGFCPKIGAVVSIMPQSVLGGAAVMMFASIVVSGIQLITKKPVGSREVTIVAVTLGLGYGIGASAAATNALPYYVQLIFGGSGIVPAALVAIILNVILPPNQPDPVVDVAQENKGE
jgi:NCS2 family nucleobase:cation symporter-2